MKTIVRIHRNAQQELDEWAASLTGVGPQRRAFARVILEALIRTLEQYGGPPPGAEQEAGVRPPTYWWAYDQTFWVRFCVRDQWPPLLRFWEGRTRKITVVRVRRRRRGNPGGQSSPRP